jgi:hypothetical protein
MSPGCFSGVVLIEEWPRVRSLMRVIDPAWVRKTELLTLVMALPAAGLLAKVWHQEVEKRRSRKAAFSFTAGVIVLTIYLVSVINIAFQYSVLFMLVSPLLGFVVSLSGIVSVFWAPAEQRVELFMSHLMLCGLMLASLVMPN